MTSRLKSPDTLLFVGGTHLPPVDSPPMFILSCTWHSYTEFLSTPSPPPLPDPTPENKDWVVQGWGTTKAPLVNFLVSKSFDLAKATSRFFKPHSYLAGVTAAELWRHLSNMNVIFDRSLVFYDYEKLEKITERRKYVLLPPLQGKIDGFATKSWSRKEDKGYILLTWFSFNPTHG